MMINIISFREKLQCTVVGGGDKSPWSSEQIEVNLSFLEAFGYILSRKLFLNILKA